PSRRERLAPARGRPLRAEGGARARHLPLPVRSPCAHGDEGNAHRGAVARAAARSRLPDGGPRGNLTGISDTRVHRPLLRSAAMPQDLTRRAFVSAAAAGAVGLSLRPGLARAAEPPAAPPL